ncbi:hypothetical protein [Halococcus hamelinensis]|uniref:hypothetical protein n=1 Tax=Halococcus hamelinensis TaxID=332168 RepID=UPI000A4A4A55|nr:hypothetical protein [Halococcus hamelinensis]
MSSLLQRLPGHLILFVGVMTVGISALFVFVGATNLLAWGALTYGVVSVAVGLAVVYR